MFRFFCLTPFPGDDTGSSIVCGGAPGTVSYGKGVRRSYNTVPCFKELHRGGLLSHNALCFAVPLLGL